MNDPETPAIGITLASSLVTSVLALVVFSWLADEVMEGHAAAFDGAVRNAVHAHATPLLTSIMLVITHLGDPKALLALSWAAVVAFLYCGWKRAAAWLAITMAGATILDLTLKLAFHRPRPMPFFGAAPNSYSFPSGHALGSFCFFAMLAALIAHRTRTKSVRVAIGVTALLLIAAIGFSRIYLGVHYPSDVIAGYAAAAIWVCGLTSMDRFRRRRLDSSAG